MVSGIVRGRAFSRIGPGGLACAILWILGTTSCWAANLDSLGIEIQDGTAFIMHRVESKETLYSLARRYHTQVSEIEKANPTLGNGLKIGQTLRIPSTPGGLSQGQHIVRSSETLHSIGQRYGVTIQELKVWNHLTQSTLEVGQVLIVRSSASTFEADFKLDPQSKYHKVQPGQTLYSVASIHGATVDQLRQWNDISGDDLRVGQMLIVGSVEVVADSIEYDVPQQEERIERTHVQLEEIPQKEIPPTIIVSPNEVGKDRIVKQQNGFTEILENGLAEVIDNSKDTRKYLALHKTAPVGTILQIRNEMNNLRVFVRVIGQLPNTGNNDKILIKISKAAYDRLGAIDARFPVVLTYFL